MSGYLRDTADGGQQHSGEFSDPQEQLWVNANILDDIDLPGPNADVPTEAFPQLWNRNESSLPMDFQQNNNFQNNVVHAYDALAGDRRPPECIDPSALTRADPCYGISASFSGYSPRYPVIAMSNSQVGSSTYVGVRGDPGNEGAVNPYVDIAYQLPSALPMQIPGQAGGSRGPDNNFISGVLGRQFGHREALGVDTARLIARLGVRDNQGGGTYQVYDVDPSANAYHHDIVMENSHDTIALPQSMSEIQAQRSSAGQQQQRGVISNGFQYVVREGTPVNIDLKINSASTRTCSDWLHPESVSQHSGDAPSPTSTATSTDGLGCSNCEAMFTGRWQRSNLNRHLRLKHAGEAIVQYPCEDDICTRRFNRMDARLKHYRKKHPHLSSGPPVLRGSPSVTGSDQMDLHHVQEVQNRIVSRGAFEEGTIFPLDGVQGIRSYPA